MSATFKIRIDSVRTGAVGALASVIRKVEFTLIGTESGQEFQLPGFADLGEPDPNNFVPFSSLTEEQVASFVESSFAGIDPMKAHMQSVLDKEIAKATLENTPLPWAPAPAPMPTPPEA